MPMIVTTDIDRDRYYMDYINTCFLYLSYQLHQISITDIIKIKICEINFNRIKTFYFALFPFFQIVI